MPEQLLANGDIICSMTNEQLALLMANERYRMCKPIFDACGFGIELQIIAAKMLQWLNTPVEVPSDG